MSCRRFPSFVPARAWLGFSPLVTLAAGVVVFALCLAAPGDLGAQQMPPPPPPIGGLSPAGGPQTPPVTLPGLPIAPAPGTSVGVGTEPANVRIYYPQADIKEILELYANYTGKRVLPDPTVQGSVTILVNSYVTRSEAIRIIETQLRLNGFNLVQEEGNIVKVLGLGKQLKNESVPIYSDVSQLPTGQQVVSFLKRLNYLDPTVLQGVLAQYVQPTNANFTIPVPQSGAMILTDTASTVRKLVNLIDQLDVPGAPVVEEFIKLERADAQKAVDFLNAAFDAKNSATPGAAPGTGAAASTVRRLRRTDEQGQPVFDNINPAPGVTASAGGGLNLINAPDTLIQGKVQLQADIRTNRVHVVTQRDNLPIIRKLLHDFDLDTPFGEPATRPLKFVNARDVLPILVTALTEPGSQQNNGGADNATNTNTNNANNRNNNFFNNSNSSGSSLNGGLNGSGGGGDVNAEDLSADVVDTHPDIKVVGNTKIIADPRSNTITLLGNAEAKDKIMQLLDKLDVRVPQVFISAVVGELSLGDDNEYGINYLLRQRGLALTNQFGSGFTGATTSGTTTGGTTTTFTPTNNSTLSTLTTLASGLPSGFGGVAGILSVTHSFDIILSALESSNRFKTLSRPALLTTNNKPAVITSGQEIAVPTNSLSSLTSATDQAAVSTNVQFREVALTLSVVPLVNSDKEVTLSIAQTINSVVQGANVTVGGNSIPTIATRKVKSYVSMPNDATVVLGGLITQSDSITDAKVPILNKIPLLGDLLFKSRTRNKNRGELIVLIHPQVLPVPEVLEVKRMQEERKLNLEPGLEQQLDPLPKVVRRATAVYSDKNPATGAMTTSTTTTTAVSTPRGGVTKTTATTTTQTKGGAATRKKAVSVKTTTE